MFWLFHFQSSYKIENSFKLLSACFSAKSIFSTIAFGGPCLHHAINLFKFSSFPCANISTLSSGVFFTQP